MIDSNRRTTAPALSRLVVAVDPAVTSNENSAETGIVMVGRGEDGDFYVLSDRSLKASPDGWGRVAVAELKDHGADRIVGEVNNGGDMVEHVVRTVDRYVSFKAVRATRGKFKRAEPVAALYEQGRVHHVGVFATLGIRWSPSILPSRISGALTAWTRWCGGSPIWWTRRGCRW